MTKRWKQAEVLPSTAALPFSGFESRDAQVRSAAPKRRSAVKPPPPAPDATPIPRAPGATNLSALSSRPVAVEPRPSPQRGARPAAPGAPHGALRVRELGALLGRHFAALPCPVTVLCEACVAAETSVAFVLTTSREDYEQACKLGLVVLHGAEVSALTLAAELGRATPIEFEHWLELKQRTREAWELTPRVTLGVHVSRHNQAELSIQRVLKACGASILDVAAATPAPPNFWEACCG